MLTADTITDAQIWSLRARQRAEGHRTNMAICDVALGRQHGARWDEIHEARARCADAINKGQ